MMQVAVEFNIVIMLLSDTRMPWFYSLYTSMDFFLPACVRTVEMGSAFTGCPPFCPKM